MKHSKAVKGESGASLRATIIDEVFELHRRSYHYSIKKRNPKLYENIISETKNIPLDILQKSYDIYKGVKQDNGKVPHPNYFLKVALGSIIQKREEGNIPETKTQWGKTI